MATRYSLTRFLARFSADKRGATAIEYGLIAALIFLAIIVGFTSFASTTTGLFDDIGAAVEKV